MGRTYVLLEMDDDDAKALVKDLVAYPDSQIMTPVREEPVDATVRAVYKKPTAFCDRSDGHARSAGKMGSTWTRGKKYGWLVCTTCGKPSPAWGAQGSMWFSTHGINLLPPETPGSDEWRPLGWDQTPAQWNFLKEYFQVRD